MQRPDDFNDRRQHLATLSEEQLEKRFWELAFKVVEPLIELARKNTSPSIERSVLLRMGLSSLTANAVVDQCVKNGLLGHGAGNIVLRYARVSGMDIKEAARALAKGKGWEQVQQAFQRGEDYAHRT